MCFFSQKNRSFTFKCFISDMNVSDYDEQQIKIRLLDENDELPQFHNIPRPFLAMISSNTAPGSSVYQLMARDDDKDSLVEYILESGIYIRLIFKNL